jgi:hypothetical protein
MSNNPMTDIVECHSGSSYADKPTALHWYGQRLIIAEILSQGRTPQVKWFRVRSSAGQVFELSLAETASEDPSVQKWQIHPL